MIFAEVKVNTDYWWVWLIAVIIIEAIPRIVYHIDEGRYYDNFWQWLFEYDDYFNRELLTLAYYFMTLSSAAIMLPILISINIVLAIAYFLSFTILATKVFFRLSNRNK